MPRFRVGKDAPWYEFDGNRLLVKEARQLEELTGMGLRDFSEGLQRGKVDAMVFMIYLAKRRSGEPVQWRDFDDVDIAQLEMEADEPQRAEGAPVDPTKPAEQPDVSSSVPVP